jgi:PAS domain S-box-containing protein
LFYFFKKKYIKIQNPDTIAKTDLHQFETIFNLSPIIQILVNNKLEILNANQKCKDFISNKNIIGNQLGNIFNCEYFEDLKNICGVNDNCKTCLLKISITETFESKKNIYKNEITLNVYKNSKNLTRNLIFSLYYISDLKTPKVLICVDDISENKSINKKLIESEKKYRNIFENASIGIFQTTIDGKLLEANQYCAKIFGYDTPEELIKSVNNTSKNIYLFPEERFQNIQKILNVIEMITVENHLKRKNGQVFIGKMIIRNNENKFFDCLIADISERKITELKLIQSEQKFRNIFDSSIDGIIITDTDGKFLDVNKKVLERTGFEKDKLLNMNYRYFLKDKIKNSDEIIEALTKNGKFSVETEYSNFYNKTIYIEMNGEYINYNDQVAILIISRDLTDRKLIQQKLLNAVVNAEEREKSKFAKDLHDGLGPIISSIKLYFQWLTKTEDVEKKKIIVEKGNTNIEEAIKTIKDISNNLSPHVLANYGLPDAIQSFADKMLDGNSIAFILKSNIKNRFQIETETTLYRIATELINNTVKYAKATEVRIKLQINQKKAKIFFKYVDNGKGFDIDSILNKKSVSGIFNIKNRINTLGGKVLIESKENKGVVVRIILPYQFIILENAKQFN